MLQLAPSGAFHVGRRRHPCLQTFPVNLSPVPTSLFVDIDNLIGALQYMANGQKFASQTRVACTKHVLSRSLISAHSIIEKAYLPCRAFSQQCQIGFQIMKKRLRDWLCAGLPPNKSLRNLAPPPKPTEGVREGQETRNLIATNIDGSSTDEWSDDANWRSLCANHWRHSCLRQRCSGWSEDSWLKGQ